MTPAEESGNAASSGIPTQSESVEDTSASFSDSQILEDWLEEETTPSATANTTDANAEAEENNDEEPFESSQTEETTKTGNDAVGETQESSEEYGIVLPDDEF